VRIRVGSLIRGTRSYECEVVGVGDKLELSSKSLDKKDFSRSGHVAHIDSKSESEGDNMSSEDVQWEYSLDEDDVDAARDDHTDVTAQDWRPVDAFDDLLMQRHLNMAIYMLKEGCEGMLAEVCATYFWLASPCTSSKLASTTGAITQKNMPGKELKTLREQFLRDFWPCS
jgi:hypothetical protein